MLHVLGYTHHYDHKAHPAGVSHIVKRDGVEVYSSTRSNAYELCVLWLLKTRQVKLTPDMERAANGYRRFGLAAEVDAALSAARNKEDASCATSNRAE